MPRGKFTNHKGRNRRFTNPEELEEERRKEEQKKKWRQQHGDESSEESEDEQKDNEGSESGEEEESSDEEEQAKAKGVSNLIEIENPNRVQKKTKKLSTLNTADLSDKPQLSRREREEIEKQKAQAHYQKLHSEGKTDQARADLARLAIIKQQREEAKKRREAEQKEKEEAAKAKTAATQKALGKKIGIMLDFNNCTKPSRATIFSKFILSPLTITKIFKWKNSSCFKIEGKYAILNLRNFIVVLRFFLCLLISLVHTLFFSKSYSHFCYVSYHVILINSF